MRASHLSQKEKVSSEVGNSKQYLSIGTEWSSGDISNGPQIAWRDRRTYWQKG